MQSRSQIFWLVALVCFWATGTDSIRAQDSNYQAAVSLVQQRQFDQALPLLQQILDRSPNDIKARNLMGIALSAAGRREEANDQFKKILALDPKFVPALKNLALNELSLNLVEDARLHFEEALKSAPQDATCHWGLAEIAFTTHDFERAVAHYEQSGDLALKDPSMAIKFARSQIEVKQPTKAAALLEKLSWEIDANLQFQVGIMLAQLEKFGTAARRFELARNGYPDPYRVGYNLTLVLIKNGDYAAAIRVGEGMLAANYRKAELYNLLAQAYVKLGKTKEAYDSLRAATGLEPHGVANYLDLITLCLESQNYELGLEIADIGLRLIPKSSRLHLQRGVILVNQGQLEEAVKEFQTSTQLSPAEELPYIALGLALIQMDKQPEAITMLRQQSEKNPKDSRLFWLLGEALSRSAAASRSKEEKEAIDALEKSIQLDPRLPQPRALLGKILLRRGEIDRAALELEKALELDPEDLTATYQLAQAIQRKGDTARAKQLFDQVAKAKSKGGQSPQRNLMRIIKSGSQ